MRRIRRYLVAPIVWWSREIEQSNPLRQSAWERGRVDAINAAKDGRMFGLASTAATCAAPTIVGFETTHLPAFAQIFLIVVAAIGGYILVPTIWAIVGTLRAPVRQRDEARQALSSSHPPTAHIGTQPTIGEYHAHGTTNLLLGQPTPEMLRQLGLLESRFQTETSVPEQRELRSQADEQGNTEQQAEDDGR